MKPETKEIIEQLKKLARTLGPNDEFVKQSKLRLIQRLKEQTGNESRKVRKTK